MNIGIAIIAGVLSILGVYGIERCKYKVRHTLFTIMFFAGAFVCTISPPLFHNIVFSQVWTWLCFIAGVWHLTKACFFIETDELKKGK